MSDVNLDLTINGANVRLKDISPTVTLLEYLRASGRVGTKEGCGDGDCGACTVAIVAEGADGKPHYQAMNSCLIPLASVAGREIITVEGVANGELHPVQAAMVETLGSQCGYCTPGFVMSLFAAYYDRTVDDLSVEGNLCRCTGYLSIRRAAALVNNAVPEDMFAEQLSHATTAFTSLDYSGNEQHFYRPIQLSEVLTLLQQHPDATLVAGGTDLGLELSHHRQHFPVMVSLEAVAELKRVEQTPETVVIGAAVPLSHVETNLHGIFPSLDEMLHWFAARQIRNRATLGGNLGTASPIGDLPPVLLSLDAELTIASLTGTRTVLLADFFKGYRQTALQRGEVIVSVSIPKTIASGSVRRLSQSYKIGKRGTDDISIVAAAFTIDLDASDRIVHARLAYGGVAATPVRAITIETLLIGQPWTLATIQRIKPTLRATFTPITDFRGSADYRKQLIANLFEKFFVEFSNVNADLLKVTR
ncbi:xanthine dehydrogenase small subunit [Leptolyngbya sp. FACHB-321]|uniref:xanthine dehydrogenase small subunit n=1 Tax=Leptolyngbya sp. FACHB-321 TaxID=2692807 RepID=UPI001682C2BC|nr:xanthine dehydrogenase small subunit [Leptolyngbya sp. FACHB-321]MBD2036244.1 xanthine dehydrogenase small subunit [Leptolyngbya sp. FACHB-321]